MAAPHLWQAPQPPSIGGTGAFSRPPLRTDGSEPVRPVSADHGHNHSAAELRSGSDSPRMPRRFSAEDSAYTVHPVQVSPALSSADALLLRSAERSPRRSPQCSPTLRAQGEPRLLCALMWQTLL